MTGWELPTSVELGGAYYAVNTDFRDILEIINYLQNPEDTPQLRIMVALALFYDNWECVPKEHWQEAMQQLMWFISGGEEEQDDRPSPKLIDWEQDKGLIVSDINCVAGCEIRALPHLHWWTFLSWFGGIGEGRLSTVVAIRNKLRKGKKLEKWESEYYRENRSVVDFHRKYTSEEDALLMDLLGGGETVAK